MRPSKRLITLVFILAAVSIFIGLTLPDGAGMVVMIWGGAVLFGLVDLLMTPSAKTFDLNADLVETGFTGANAPLNLSIRAKKNSLPAHLEMRLHHGTEITPTPAAQVLFNAPGTKQHQMSWPLGLRERGQSKLTRLSVRFQSRFGLFEMLPSWPLNLNIDIVANIAPVLNGEIHTQMLPLLDGLKDMNLRGEGSEFHQLREFQIGMDPRSIDWKRSARMRNMVARETRAERNHQIIICLDSGHLMGEHIDQLSKLDHAINASLSLAWAGGIGGDNVGFYNFDSRPQTFIPPRPGKRAFGHIQRHSAVLQQDTAETNHTLGLTRLDSHLSRRSLVVVFSDFVDSTSAELLVENLSVMTRKHLVLYVALRDPDLQAIAHPDHASMAAVSEAVSARQILREREAVLDKLQRLGILCLDTHPKHLTASLISRYIDIKAQERI